MNLFDATLELARKVTTVRVGTTTAVTTTSLTDTNAALSVGEYKGGSFWMLTGTGAGGSRKITQQTESKITWVTALTIQTGKDYAIANADYPMDLLRQAINEPIH